MMMSRTLIPALLFTFSWMSVSVSEFHTEEAQPGEEVTLLCSNFSSIPSHVVWFRLNSTSNVSPISSMFISDGNATFFQNSTYDTTSNGTHLFLKIKPVELWDSGLYFCGLILNKESVIVSATYLKVEAFFGRNILMDMILGALIAFLSSVIFALFLIIRKFKTAQRTEEQNPQRSEIDASLDLHYAALTFQPKAKSRKRSPAEKEQETSVLYAASS
ncbi:uncharacterized protein LOC117807579 [Notolabrus celidotus]|uniref:uncharacterized protein LOC117807579 n=1 Tax=Notolabrus celidotus TaxID=1203425 RepID=UPI00148F4535|nr:uncharacterized protein LOC117807579 [Notolabrus celidotus]XP_034532804.1 uncharacterized protein LOC117807579 [Notolabrus celidotus]